MEIMSLKSIFVLHPLCEPIAIVGMLEGWPDMWWGRMHVWVGPVVWGIIEAHSWGSGTSRRGEVHLWWSVCMHGAMWDVLGIWARRKGGQMCGGARCVSGWGLLCGALLRGIVEGHCWGSSTSLWGLGYMVQPGDMLALGICMCLVRKSMRGHFSRGAPEVSGTVQLTSFT